MEIKGIMDFIKMEKEQNLVFVIQKMILNAILDFLNNGQKNGFGIYKDKKMKKNQNMEK